MQANRISLNKLVEYCLANGPRRTKIIEDILQTKAYLVDTGYNDIEHAFTRYVSSHGLDDTSLRDLDRQFQLREARTEHEETRLLNAHDMIERAVTLDVNFLDKFEVDSAAKMPKFEIAGLLVNVAPTNLTMTPQRGKRAKAVGVLKPYFSKTAPLTTKRSAEKAALHGIILHWYAETFLSHLGDVIPNACFSVDIFSQSVTTAPTAFKARRKQVQYCAQEICDRWEPIRSRLMQDGKLAIAATR
jgi:hypothetical protein